MEQFHKTLEQVIIKRNDSIQTKISNALTCFFCMLVLIVFDIWSFELWGYLQTELINTTAKHIAEIWDVTTLVLSYFAFLYPYSTLIKITVKVCAIPTACVFLFTGYCCVRFLILACTVSDYNQTFVVITTFPLFLALLAKTFVWISVWTYCKRSSYQMYLTL